jgi:DNA mismatch endonuclease (patch repair protein)
MADIFSIAKRSKVMAKIRGRGNRSTELRFLALLKAHKIKGWRRHMTVAGRPDFAFPQLRLAIFVDGCFWHGCSRHCVFPKSNRVFWRTKIQRNRIRDRLVARTLRTRRWRVFRVWEHELRRDGTQELIRKVRQAIAAARARSKN